MRQSTVNQHNSIKGKMMLVETTSTAATTSTSRVKEIKKLNANNLSPLNSPQLIRSTRARVAESNGWTNSVKVKSSCSSGSNSVESIVPKYQIATNASILSQKRSYLNQNQTSTVNKLTNKTMNMRNDKTKKEVSESIAMQKAIMNGVSVKKTVSTATAKKLLKTTFPTPSPSKSFSSKFPNGLPFENEFYHYRKNNHRSSVASDSTNSNNSSDEFNNQRLSNSPYHDEFRRNPSNDALYVDFTLKSFDKFDTEDDKKIKKKVTKQPQPLTTKTKYILTDKNCFCEFETVKSSGSSTKSSNSGQQQVDFITAQSAAKTRVNKDAVVYVTSASIFPKCNRVEEMNENAIANTK
jgi:hypothetical protein